MRIAFVGDSLTRGVPGHSFVEVLHKRLPQDTLINLGKGNDTAISLYRRIARLRFDAPFDFAFLWVGVNDISVGDSWLAKAYNALRGQPRSRNLDEFRQYYRATLDLLSSNARRVIAVSPLLKGEAIDNECNRELAHLAQAIQELAAHDPRVTFLDLRAVLVPRLAKVRVSDYTPGSAIRVAFDVLTLRSREQVDRVAARRGLHYTLDGLHLNGAGAELVAETFLEAIRSNGSPPSPQVTRI